MAAYKVLETHQIIKHSSEVFAAFFDVRAFINLVTADPSATSCLLLNSQKLPFESVQNVQAVDADRVLVLLQLPKLPQTKPVFSLIAEGAENEFRGNSSNYYKPTNSYIDKVLATKHGKNNDLMISMALKNLILMFP